MKVQAELVQRLKTAFKRRNLVRKGNAMVVAQQPANALSQEMFGPHDLTDSAMLIPT